MPLTTSLTATAILLKASAIDEVSTSLRCNCSALIGCALAGCHVRAALERNRSEQHFGQLIHGGFLLDCVRQREHREREIVNLIPKALTGRRCRRAGRRRTEVSPWAKAGCFDPLFNALVNQSLPRGNESSGGVRVVSYADWQSIDAAEIRRGQPVGKPREKFTRLDEMLNVRGSDAAREGARAMRPRPQVIGSSLRSACNPAAPARVPASSRGRSARSALTVSTLSSRFVPIIPVGPRLIQPETLFCWYGASC